MVVHQFRFIGASGSAVFGNPTSINQLSSVKRMLNFLARPHYSVLAETSREQPQMSQLQETFETFIKHARYNIPHHERKFLKKKQVKLFRFLLSLL